jgi:pimeloyl-ACP methyl ester carboxylesterase
VLTDPELATGFLELHRSLETLTRRPEQDEKLAEWLHALIERHTAHRPTRPPLAGRDDRALRLALEYLAERPERNVDELAVAAGIGKFHLVRLFRERTGLPLKALAYVDAYIPDQGQTLVQLTGAGSCFAVKDLTSVFNFVPIPGAPSEDLDTYVKPSVFPGCFANGLPAQRGAVLAATQRPLTTAALNEPSGVPAWKTIPSWALVGLHDHVIPPAGQLAMARNAGAKITEVHAPHLSMISDPAAVTKVIEQAAKATS